MRLIYGKYTGVRARRVLVFDTSRRPAIRTESNTEKRNHSGRGIAANLLGDCRAHSETVIPVFIPYLHIRISVAFRHLAYHLFAYGADEHAFVPTQEVVI